MDRNSVCGSETAGDGAVAHFGDTKSAELLALGIYGYPGVSPTISVLETCMLQSEPGW